MKRKGEKRKKKKRKRYGYRTRHRRRVHGDEAVILFIKTVTV